eukprot:TRINITY_DN15290_c0_g1_i1.p1 TRINITY_DN15290_c0_g1~~TRINITY_DN15290_c0_g1_i1.p1  ORF type:complete len:369 (-),score=112.71 TRINITY_DN15290_c0_g1_i1:247-1353(-)
MAIQISKVFLAVLLLVSSAYCWSSRGHEIIAQIAKLNMKPEVIARVESYLKINSHDFGYDGDMVAAASWADRLKNVNHLDLFKTMHYTDIPVIEEGFEPTVSTSPNYVNSVFALDAAWKNLLGNTAVEYTRLMSLRFVIHLVGDTTQPLHCASLFSEAFPKGDHGGNSIKCCKSQTHWANLHAFWDDCGGLCASTIYENPPLSNQIREDVLASAQKFMKDYPITKFATELEPANLVPEKVWDWVHDTNALAASAAYTNITFAVDGTKLLDGDATEFYQKRAQEVSKSQIALGGYRLAKILDELYGNLPELSVRHHEKPKAMDVQGPALYLIIFVVVAMLVVIGLLVAILRSLKNKTHSSDLHSSLLAA